MEYNDDLAEKLQRKYNLAGSTVRTWKMRNSIPNKYEDPNYQPTEKASKKDLERLHQLINLDYLYNTRFEGVKKYRLRDFKVGEKNARITKEEVQAVKQQLRDLKKHLKRFISKPTDKHFGAIYQHPLVKIKVLVGYQDKESPLNPYKKKFNEAEFEFLKKKFQTVLEEIPF